MGELDNQIHRRKDQSKNHEMPSSGGDPSGGADTLRKVIIRDTEHSKKMIDSQHSIKATTEKISKRDISQGKDAQRTGDPSTPQQEQLWKPSREPQNKEEEKVFLLLEQHMRENRSHYQNLVENRNLEQKRQKKKPFTLTEYTQAFGDHLLGTQAFWIDEKSSLSLKPKGFRAAGTSRGESSQTHLDESWQDTTSRGESSQAHPEKSWSEINMDFYRNWVTTKFKDLGIELTEKEIDEEATDAYIRSMKRQLGYPEEEIEKQADDAHIKVMRRHLGYSEWDKLFSADVDDPRGQDFVQSIQRDVLDDVSKSIATKNPEYNDIRKYVTHLRYAQEMQKDPDSRNKPLLGSIKRHRGTDFNPVESAMALGNLLKGRPENRGILGILYNELVKKYQSAYED